MSATLDQTPVVKSPEVERRPSQRGEPVWELARFYPRQGEWTEKEYFALEDTRFIELKDGCLEFLPIPKRWHQLLARVLFRMLDTFVEKNQLGEAHFTGLNIRLAPGQIRVPDVVFLSTARLGDPHEVQDLADLMIEVVSPGYADRQRDLIEKRTEYAQAAIPEYWIVDPQTETITVLTLPAGASEYAMHGEFRAGETATSVLLAGLAVDVAACFAAAKREE